MLVKEMEVNHIDTYFLYIAILRYIKYFLIIKIVLWVMILETFYVKSLSNSRCINMMFHNAI